MRLQIKHLFDLQSYRFNVPIFQRGYRWEERQVRDLLNDLFDFVLSKAPVGAFYCLQPLVVVRNTALSSDGGEVYDVIDGQQRLTTLYLILRALDNDVFYTLRYERAAAHAINYEDGLLTSLLNDDEAASHNPDIFYLKKAEETIREWIIEKKESFPKVKRKREDVLLPPDYQHHTDDTVDPNALLNDVRFIYYDATEETDGQRALAIDIFQRLNYGKTPLSAYDLIKALLLQTDVYPEGMRVMRRQIAFTMASQWDEMEKQLQDKFFYAMLSAKERRSHLALVLDFVADDLKYEVKGLLLTYYSKDDPLYPFYLFNQAFPNDAEARAEKVDALWRKIQDIFAVFRAWYHDHDLYHYIGLTQALPDAPSLYELQRKYMNNSKPAFIKWIKQRIFSQTHVEKDQWKNYAYGTNDKVIQNLLLLYNVDICRRHKQDAQRFPFYFFHQSTPSLEHIHPQHLDVDKIEFEVLKLLVNQKLAYLDSHSECKADQDACCTLREVFASEDEAAFKNNKEKCQQALQILDEFFDELAGIKEEELHSIANLALVDKNTNTSLSNALIRAKRDTLLRLSQEYDDTDGREGALTFAGTWKVFNKTFSRQNLSPDFWTQEDRDNYLSDIEKTLKDYYYEH